jgi:hypothetical protein
MECDGRTLEESKQCLPTVLSIMAGSIKQLCVCALSPFQELFDCPLYYTKATLRTLTNGGVYGLGGFSPSLYHSIFLQPVSIYVNQHKPHVKSESIHCQHSCEHNGQRAEGSARKAIQTAGDVEAVYQRNFLPWPYYSLINLTLLTYFPFFNNESRLIWSPWTPEPIFMKFDAYVMATEHISKAYFINPSHRSVCPYVYPYMVARQFLGKHVLAAMNT